MPEPSLFRHYLIVQDADGINVELTRNAEQVCVLGFDTQRLEFVHCHVLMEPLADRNSFTTGAQQLQSSGHPLLARLIDFGEDEGNPFYITSNVDGESLASFLTRQTELPGWLAVLISCRALDAAAALCGRADLMPAHPLEALRLVQTGPQCIQVQVADYALSSGHSRKTRGLKTAFEKQAKFLRSFLEEKAGGPSLADTPLPAADFMELLHACLAAATLGTVPAMRQMRAALQKLVPETLTGEIPSAHKPRALLAPQLASYQEVARALVNRVRIQSQRLDMANPYAMRGTLTKTGRAVLVEQVPPLRLAAQAVHQAAEKAFKFDKKRDFSAILPVVLLQEAEGLVCMAEELAEGITLADVLKDRRALNVQETYLVLAGLDSALTQVEKSGLEVSRLRLEDIFLLTGFPREDARSTKLLLTKLTDWPAFSVMLRAHPTLAAMACRGTDPALLLPPVKVGAKPTSQSSWQAPWLAALARFLLALEPLPGAFSESSANTREIETVARLLDDELAKSHTGGTTSRADFLARYARVVHHHDLVKPVASPPSEPLESQASRPLQTQRTRPIGSPALAEASSPLIPLTSGGSSSSGSQPTVGFAELLFRGTSETASTAGGPDWAKTAVDAPPTIQIRETLLPPEEFVPLWLKASVFIGSSIILGAIFAHLSGHALWQKKGLPMPPKTSQGIFEGKTKPTPKQASSSNQEEAVPKAVPVSIPQAAEPVAEDPAASARQLLRPPSQLRDQLRELPPRP